jgi:hypothetical protein
VCRWRLSAAALAVLFFVQITVLQAAVTIVDSASTWGAPGVGTTVTVGLTGVQSGDAICACGGVESQTVTMDLSVDNGSMTLVHDIVHSGASRALRMECALNVSTASPATITMTLSAGEYHGLMAAALRSVATSSANEDDDEQEGFLATAVTDNISATSNGIVVGCLGSSGNHTITPAANWTELEENESGAASTIGSMTYRLSAASGTYAPEWSFETDTDWVAIGVQLKEASGGGLDRMLRGFGR